MAIIKGIKIDKFRGFKDVTIPLGGDVVAITGQNGTQKTTLLGMLSQPFSLSNPDAAMYGAKTIDGSAFGSQLSDKFKFSPKFDVAGAHAWTLTLDEDVCGRSEFSCVSIARQKNKNADIRFWSADKSRKKGTGYIHVPVVFLSLKRLLPIGELPKIKDSASSLTTEEAAFFKEWHNKILYCQTQIDDVRQLSATGKSSLAPSTPVSDALTISAGQDNVGKIILSVLSFKRLSESHPHDYRGGLMFVDEFETAMYPAAQIQLLKFMFKFASKYRIQFFLSTHSETILRYLKVSKYSRVANVVFLKKIDERISAYTDRSLPQIENNLFLDAFEDRISSPLKIRVYAEDDKAFVFLKSMLPLDLKKIVEFQTKITLGAGHYKILIERKVPEFVNSVVVLDGDKNGFKDGIKESDKAKFPQVAFLPGKDCPEKLLFGFFHGLTEGDPFWDNENNTFTKQISFASFSTPPAATDGFKNWFAAQKDLNGQSMQGKMIKYWVKKHPDEVRAFRDQFVKAYNVVAPKIGVETIAEPKSGCVN